MATLASSCDSCIEAKIPHCADLYQVCGVLTADTEYTSVITDRFGKKHILTDVTDADGIWTIDPADYPDGFFSQHGGPKVLQFYTDQNLCDLVTISIGDPAVDYTCISLKVFEASEEQATWDVLCLCDAAPAEQRFVYGLYLDVTGYSVGTTIESVNINGTDYLAGVYGSGTIGGAANDGFNFSVSISTALQEHGIDVNTFYTFGQGNGLNQITGESYVAFGLVAKSSVSVFVRWTDGNGATFVGSPVLINNNQSLCAAGTGDSTADICLLYNFTFPKYGGGTSTFDIGTLMFPTIEFISSDLLVFFNPFYVGTFYPDLVVAQNGGEFTVSGVEFFIPINSFDSSNGTITFSPCP